MVDGFHGGDDSHDVALGLDRMLAGPVSNGVGEWEGCCVVVCHRSI